MKKTPQPAQAPNSALQGYERFKHVMGIVITWLYHLRKVVLACCPAAGSLQYREFAPLRWTAAAI